MSLSARKDSLKSPQNEAFVRARARGKSERARDRKGTRLEAAGAKGGPESGTRAAKERAALCVSSYHAALYGPLIFAALSRARALRFCRTSSLSTLHTSTADRGRKTLYTTGPLPFPPASKPERKGVRASEPLCPALYGCILMGEECVCACVRARQTICTVALSLSLGSSVWESRANCMYMRAV